MNKTLNLLSGAAFAVLALSGCNTTEGLGEDISKAGSAISHAATETSAKISDDHTAAKPQPYEDKVVTSKKTVRHHGKKAAASKKTVAVVTAADGDKTTTTSTETKTTSEAN